MPCLGTRTLSTNVPLVELSKTLNPLRCGGGLVECGLECGGVQRQGVWPTHEPLPVSFPTDHSRTHFQ